MQKYFITFNGSELEFPSIDDIIKYIEANNLSEGIISMRVYSITHQIDMTVAELKDFKKYGIR
jgi:hypothetical protein